MNTKLALITILMLVFWEFFDPAFASPADKGMEEKEVFRLTEIKRWDDVYTNVNVSNIIINKVLKWMDYIRPETKATFTDITNFIRNNPTWPQLTTLVRNAENSITMFESREVLQQWFLIHPPLTVNGKIIWAKTLYNVGLQSQAGDVIRELWIHSDLSYTQEKRILGAYSHYLRYEDHIARLDHLLWEHKINAARRMLLKVSIDWRLLAEARISLASNQINALSKFAEIPPRLRDHPGVIYELVQWNRRRHLYQEAISILLHLSSDEIRPDKLWKERSILVRKALSLGRFRQAYAIVYQHGNLDLEQAIEAEWLEGWIALRWLRDTKLAYSHFIRMYNSLNNSSKENVSALTNLPRAAYWAGRTAEDMGKRSEAYTWYLRASVYATSYYGQLSAGHLDGARTWDLVEGPIPTVEEVEEFNKHELVHAATLLLISNQQKALRSFILRLGELAKTPSQYILTARFALSAQRPDLAVILARRSEKFGTILVTLGYPVVTVYNTVIETEQALVLAIIRQESSFYANAISTAGARGLMQLMPSTARQVALDRKLSFTEDALITNPEYNITIGTAFLESLLSTFKGSYILTAAAYNAGYSRVEAWIKDFGDPRRSLEKSIDWIESIPFSETRNYVQRVLENTQIYRRRIGHTITTQLPGKRSNKGY